MSLNLYESKRILIKEVVNTLKSIELSTILSTKNKNP